MAPPALIFLVVAGLMAASCTSGEDPEGASAPVVERPNLSAPLCPQVDDRRLPPPVPLSADLLDLEDAVELTTVASISRGTTIAFRCGDDTAYVGDREGRIWAVPDAASPGSGGEPQQLVDLSEAVKDDGAEQGFLAMTFSVDGSRLWILFTDERDIIRLDELEVTDDGTIDPDTRTLLSVNNDEGEPVHNGGALTIGPDGLLYVSIGDGGPETREHAQNVGSLPGSILRIIPDPDGDAPYSVPDDNPFVDEPGARPEIWAYGLRNPWRFSFDRGTGDLWVADVGDIFWEEISRVPDGESAGTNFGWPHLEGNHPYFRAPEGAPPDDTWPAIYEYPHDAAGCAVVGGHVYRGTAVPALAGAYVFADLCSATVEALVLEGDALGASVRVGEVEGFATSFGESPAGELFVVTDAALYRLDPAA